MVVGTRPCLAPSIRSSLVRRYLLHPTLQNRRPASTQASGSGQGGSSSGSDGNKPIKPSKYEKQRRNEWIIVGVSGAVASLGAWSWYKLKSGPQSSSQKSLLPEPSRMAFSIPTRSPLTGERVYKSITTLTDTEVNSRLNLNEKTVDLAEKKDRCLVARYDINSVASNDPIEDRSAQIIVERDNAVDTSKDAAAAKATATATATTADRASASPSDLAFFAVMDGHAGWHTSSYLSQKLIAFVALELDKVFRETGEYADMAKAKASMPIKLWRAIAGGEAKADSRSADQAGLDWDPTIVKRAISKAFVGLDKEICNTPIELLKEYELSKASSSITATDPPSSGSSGRTLSSLAHSIFPSPGSNSKDGHVSVTTTAKSAYETMLPALSGSCALLTYIDSATRDVYVACTGDCRALGGWQDTRTGRWTFEPLSEDQTGRNMSEVARMQKEHPASEADRVIMRGRVLGGLEPTRAFGDARYKWTRDIQQRLHEAFLPGGKDGGGRGPPRLLQTPPYVTARPEIEWRRLPSSQSSPGSEGAATKQSQSTKELKFIVMATDGLWDMLSNEHVGGLVAGHLAQLKGTVSASELERRFMGPSASSTTASSANQTSGSTQQPTSAATPSASQQPRTVQHHPLAGTGVESTFTFEDSNLATHLVRNALGGADRWRVRALLAIPAPDARRFRDDITVNVILLHGSEASGAASGEEPSTAEPKAKL